MTASPQPTDGREAQPTSQQDFAMKTHIKLRPSEIQSGSDRVKWAEGLIRQLPENHDGRNSWLLNYAGEKHQQDVTSPSQPTSPSGDARQLPGVPDDDADFTPELARKIIAKYQDLVVALSTSRVTSPSVDARVDEERRVVAGREGWYLLAHELEQARHDYLSGMGQQGNAERKAKLEQLLWDDKGGIVEALKIAALAAPRVEPVACDSETVQVLLDLLNPLHGELDRQTYDAKVAMDFDMPSDYAHDVMVTAKMERDLTQAVCILENRKRAVEGDPLCAHPAPPDTVREDK